MSIDVSIPIRRVTVDGVSVPNYQEPVETATYYTGDTEPASSLGVNGDLYCKLKSGDA